MNLEFIVLDKSDLDNQDYLDYLDGCGEKIYSCKMFSGKLTFSIGHTIIFRDSRYRVIDMISELSINSMSHNKEVSTDTMKVILIES